ncbi:MAG: Trm112 family protein [Betaproteobacteria bacterium AqS2]|uniref:Trm112 family protein n=1 Tax=Candidatus Amphirhobacter heronislandensis TaxID=1732024 RepID=A0A930XX92_9GAMM|nr:Trm112 family protein [Betaproteobacteria bacterium AqS2]
MTDAPGKPDLLDILACPECKGPLKRIDGGKKLLCPACHLAYPVTADGVPVLLSEEAENHEPGAA